MFDASDESDENAPVVAALMGAAAACLFLAVDDLPKRERSCWVKEYRKTREEISNTQSLMKELKPNASDYRNFLRMDEDSFNFLLSKIRTDTEKRNTHLRDAICVEEKLAVTLRFLATGESYMDLDYNSKLSKSFLCEAIIDVCDAIYKHLKPQFLNFPTTAAELAVISDDYRLKSQFPNCLSALDGKHIRFKPAKKNATLYYNYKGFHSVVLLGLADAYGKSIYIDVGCNGRVSDGGVLQRSNLKYVLLQADKVLPPKKLVGNHRLLPHVFVADNAFPLSPNMLTPYPFTTTDENKKMFNKRLSRARQTIERAFGILSNRFRIFQTTINLREDKVIRIVQCCCVLHNFLISTSEWYTENQLTDGNETPQSRGNVFRANAITTKNGEVVRKEFMEYFNNEGKI